MTASVAELSARIASGELTPSALLADCLDTIERDDARLRAFVHVDAQGAREAARAADRRAASGQRRGALDGIPVAVKDNLFVAGMPARWGSTIFRDHVPDVDDIAVERLRKAGAILVGKTATPEFALIGRTESPVSGVTLNPVDPRLTPGGSSGGSASAVAAGMVPLALGTDAGGSIRQPAALTGVFGLRPGNARIPRRFGFPPLALDFQVIGLLARRVDELKLLYGLLAGPDPRDAFSLALAADQPVEPARIGWFDAVGGFPSDADASALCRAALAPLASASALVETIDPPYDVHELFDLWRFLTGAGIARIADSIAPERLELLTDPVREALDFGRSLSASDHVRALDRLLLFRSAVSSAWGDLDLIATPTTPSPAWEADRPFPAMVGGIAGRPRSQDVFLGWVNAMGYPAISIPVGKVPDGRPVGLQLVARSGGEATLLEVARRICPATPPASSILS